jgi:hypothetical protein
VDRLRFERLLTRRADRRRILLSADAGLAVLSFPGRLARVGARQAIPPSNALASFASEAPLAA